MPSKDSILRVLVAVISLSQIHYSTFSLAQVLDCRVPSDVVFVLDGSDSLKDNDFKSMKMFVQKLVQNLEVERDYARIGIIVFGTYPEYVIELMSTYNKDLLLARIGALKHPKSGTGTSRALQKMRDMFKNNSTRTAVRKVGVVITDGRSASPEQTKSQAAAARAEGITMLAIGFGMDQFKTELEQIAPSNVFMTDDFNKTLSVVKDALQAEVCLSPTTAPPTVPTNVPTTFTQKIVSAQLCPNCIIGKNWGFKSVPGDCTRFIELSPDADGNAIESTHVCPWGLFWNLADLTCESSHNVVCDSNPCAGKVVGSALMAGHCSSFWGCVNGKALAMCCNKGEIYVPGIGCQVDASCLETCPPEDNRIQNPVLCRNYPDPTTDLKYIEVAPSGNFSRSCPTGTAFVASDCSCSRHVTVLPSQTIQECNPEVHLLLNDNFQDASQNKLLVGIENVTINAKSARFDGNGLINLWRFSNTDFQHKFVVKLEFMSFDQGPNQQAILTNCIYSYQEESTISIVLDRTLKAVIFSLHTTDAHKQFVVGPYLAGVMNKLLFVYDGVQVTGVVNNVEVTYPLTGNIIKRQSGIVLGAGSKLGYLNGRINDFQLFMCFPTDVQKYIKV